MQMHTEIADPFEQGWTAAFPEQPAADEQARAESLFRDFYDPCRIYANEPLQTVVDWAASTRVSPEVPGLGTIEGHEVVLAEAVDLGLQAGLGDTIRLKEPRQLEIITARQKFAGRVATGVLVAVDDIYAQREARVRQLRGLRVAELPEKVVLAGKVAAMVAHEGQIRRNGNRPFYTHPDEVTSLHRMVWLRHYGKDRETDLRDDVSFLTYVHDAPEDSMDAHGKYLECKTVITPSVLTETLRRLERPHHKEIGRAALLMMRTKGQYDPKTLEVLGGNKMHYIKEYIPRGIEYPGDEALYFMLAKNSDNIQNKVIDREIITWDDPRADHKLAKQMEYTESLRMILNGIALRYPQYMLEVAMVQSLTVESVQNDVARKFRIHSGPVIRRVHEHVEESLAA